MRKTLILICAVALFSGCAMLKQAKDDYQVGKDTPIAEGETSPKDQAESIGKIISVIPGGSPIAPYAVTALTGLFAFLRGRRIRKGMPVSTNPATGFLGSASGMEVIVQALSNVMTGVFEVGADNSPIKRAWKVSLASLLGLGTVAVTIPSVQTFLLNHPQVVIGVSGISGLLGGLEKALSSVKPVVSAPVGPSIGKTT